MSEPRITQPLYRDSPDRLIENVYGRGIGPDSESQECFEQYLVERMYGPESDVAEEFKPGAANDRKVWERDGWILRPRWALLGTLLATVALNAAVNTAPLSESIVDGIGDFFEPGGQPTKAPAPATQPPSSSTTGNRSVTFNVSIPGQEQPSGVAARDTITVEKLAKEIERVKRRPHAHVGQVSIKGSASDEWLAEGERSLGVPTAQNKALSERRAGTVKTAVQKLLRRDGVKGVDIKTSSSEQVLDSGKLGTLLTTVNELGYGSITSAIVAYNEDKPMPSELRGLIGELLGSKRSVVATFAYSLNPETKKPHGPEHHAEVQKDEEHGHHKWPLPFGIIPLPILPIPRLRRRTKRLFDKPPAVQTEIPDEIEFELYQEALKRNDQLVDHSWALTRKYQALLREERIKKTLRFDYEDADEQAQSFRVGFVDHEPTPETVEAIDRLMQQVALMRRGKVAERLDMIMVFPTENTGQQHPKKIGLGIDRQAGRQVQGLAIPALGLVELHMPDKPTDKELYGFGSMSWTLAHEVAGHFTDVKSSPVSLRRVAGPRDRKNYRTSDPWLYAADDDRAMVGRLARVSARQFAIPRRYEESAQPSALTDEFLVDGHDPRLETAIFPRLRSLDPTRYAGEDAGELHAEVAAQVTTGTPIPFEEAGLDIPNALASGYRVDNQLQWRFSQHVGGLTNRDGLTWPEGLEARILASWVRHEGDVDDDPHGHSQSEHAKKSPYQADEDRLRIVAKATD